MLGGKTVPTGGSSDTLTTPSGVVKAHKWFSSQFYLPIPAAFTLFIPNFHNKPTGRFHSCPCYHPNQPNIGEFSDQFHQILYNNQTGHLRNSPTDQLPGGLGRALGHRSWPVTADHTLAGFHITGWLTDFLGIFWPNQSINQSFCLISSDLIGM